MTWKRTKGRPSIRPIPAKQVLENTAGYGLRLLAWYHLNLAAGYTLDELPKPAPYQFLCLQCADTVIRKISRQLGLLDADGRPVGEIRADAPCKPTPEGAD